MGTERRKRAGFWGVALVLCAALISIWGILVPALDDDAGHRFRGVKAAGAAPGLSTPVSDEPDAEATDEKKAAATAEKPPEEELPPYGDKSLSREKAIRGRVLDVESKPVPDAIVVAAYKDTDAYPYQLVLASRVRTEADGTFVLGPLERRSYWVLAIKKGVGVGYEEDKMPGAVVELVLAKGARVSGTVTDAESGEPVAGARVSCSDWSYWDETTTDAEGKYLLAPLPPTVNQWSGHRVMVLADGFERSERNNLILKSEVEQRIDFRLRKGKSLTGKVLDSQTLQPIEGATVAEGWEEYHKNATTDEQGAFVLANVDIAPNRNFTVRAEGYRPLERQSDGTGTLEFRLAKSEVLEGKVLDRLDNPVAGARLYLHRIQYAPGHQPQGGGGRWRTMTTSDEKGVFRFENVLPGQVAVIAFHKDHAPGESQPIQIQLGAPPPADIKVNMREGVTVAGEVRDTQENPIPNIRVELQRWFFQAKGYKFVQNYIWYESPSWYSDEKGKFELKGAIAGSLWLSVWDTNYGWTGKQVQGEDGQRIDGVILSFAGESIEGTFIDEEGAPVPGAWIQAQGPKNTPNQTWRWTRTDAIGRFKLAGLMAGDYDLSASVFNSQAEPLKDIPAGTKGVELKLKSTQLLRASVLSVLSGRPLTTFQVQIQPQQVPGRRFYGGGWSGEIKSPDGRFERPMKPGTYTIVVKARGHAPQVRNGIVVEEHVAPQEQFFQLDQGGGIEGVLRGGDGKPMRGQWVQAQVMRSPGEQAQPFDHMMGGYDVTDSQGRFFIEGVAPGTYLIQLNLGNQGSASAVVTVNGSENVKQDLALVPAGYVQFKAVDRETGEPIPQVYFQMRDPQNNNYIGGAGWTNQQGVCRSNPLRAGAATVQTYTQKNEYEIEKFDIVIESSKTINVTVEMSKREKKKPEDAPK